MTSDSTETPSVHPSPAQQRLLRLVKALGLLMALLFVGLIAGIIWKATTTKTVVPIAVEMDLGLDPASIRHMTFNNGQLAIATDKELVVVDVKQRKVLLRSAKP